MKQVSDVFESSPILWSYMETVFCEGGLTQLHDGGYAEIP